jgi:hypothetical protein
MKKTLSLFLALTLGLLFHSCDDDDDFGSGGGLQPVGFSVNANYDASFNNVAGSGATVTLVNVETSNTYTLTTNENGTASFSEVTPGTYTVSVTKQMSPAEFETTFGYTSDEEEINFNGSQTNVIVNANTTSVNIVLKTSKVGDLVLKQIHYGGSHISQGASFRDQFVEIYNNSNEVIYADGLYFAQLHGASTTATYPYTLANGQWDWSQSEGMTIGNAANTDYVYADHIFQIPGNGTQYPIQPGQGIVIAQTAINHRANYTDNAGNVQSILDPTLTLDLSNADFEAYLGDVHSSGIYRWDVQNPNVTDVIIKYWNNNRDFLMDNLGRDAFIIFRATDAQYNSWSTYKDPTASQKLCLQIPNSVIIDGVDTTRDLGTNLVPKKLQNQIDGGNTYLPSSAYSSKSVIRKTKTTIAGRVILQDTNNSTNDFVEITAQPGAFAN